jgi:hypothetical protein
MAEADAMEVTAAPDAEVKKPDAAAAAPEPPADVLTLVRSARRRKRQGHLGSLLCVCVAGAPLTRHARTVAAETQRGAAGEGCEHEGDALRRARAAPGAWTGLLKRPLHTHTQLHFWQRAQRATPAAPPPIYRCAAHARPRLHCSAPPAR